MTVGLSRIWRDSSPELVYTSVDVAETGAVLYAPERFDTCDGSEDASPGSVEVFPGNEDRFPGSADMFPRSVEVFPGEDRFPGSIDRFTARSGLVGKDTFV